MICPLCGKEASVLYYSDAKFTGIALPAAASFLKGCNRCYKNNQDNDAFERLMEKLDNIITLLKKRNS